jgi:choice-of-anchor B domain-containing protein
MKRFHVLACLAGLLIFAAFGLAQYPKQGVRLLSNMPLSSFPGSPSSGAGCAGYVSPSGQEYAIMGVRNGTVIVRITNPFAPVLIAHIPGLTSTWHEMAVLGDFCYSVADSVDQGMQIIDLRQVDQGVATLAATYRGNGLQRVHTIQANPASNCLYLNGSNRGFVMLDASNPTAPVEVARWTTKYVHDSYIKTMTSGPWAGREIAFLCCGGSDLYILDVTNKSSVTVLSITNYLSATNNYAHSGQLTEDGRYFLINDEFDENNQLVSDCSTHIVEVADLANPVYRGKFVNPINVIDHNSHLRGSYMFLAAYRGGVRVYDVSNSLAIKETGYFDTYPSGQGYSYTGAWGTFAGYPSGNIIVSDINRGLFVLDPSEAIGLGAPFVVMKMGWGTLVSGGMAELRHVDQQVLTATASPKGVTVDLSAESTVTPAGMLDVSVTAWPAGRVKMDLYNWNDQIFERMGGFNVSEAQPSGALRDIPAGNYVDSLGRIRAKVSVVPFEQGPVTVHIDQIKYTVHRMSGRK